MSGKWRHIEIITDSGVTVRASAPLIISASRATDIPAFFSKWFFNRLDKGYIKWINPFNRTAPNYVSFNNVRVIVFWTKNSKPVMEYLHILDEKEIGYYFQYTLNDYDEEGFEVNVPKLEDRIDTFISLSEMIGREKVIWRFDPLILSDKLNVPCLVDKVKRLGDRLIKYTNKLVFSFADINGYRNVKKNLLKALPYYDYLSIEKAEFTRESKIEFAACLHSLVNEWKKVNPEFAAASCAEDIDLGSFGIRHNKCVDDKLLSRLFPQDMILMDFLGNKNENTHFGTARQASLKDKGQRKDCGCIVSKDIGAYNTCSHLCVYCYANASRKRVEINNCNFDTTLDNLLNQT
jgi:DNA repair photolyase